MAGVFSQPHRHERCRPSRSSSPRRSGRGSRRGRWRRAACCRGRRGRVYRVARVPTAADFGRGGGRPDDRDRGRRRDRGECVRGADPACASRTCAPSHARVDPVPPPAPAAVTLAPSLSRHLRARGQGVAQPVTTVELFFDLVYVFAIMQLTQLILHDLTASAVARATFLLLVLWWGWICTTWMANWFDPDSPAVAALLTGVMLASLLMAAAVPRALGTDGVLFAGTFVTLQVGR